MMKYQKKIKKSINKRALIVQYTKPFTKEIPNLVRYNDKRYISNGRYSGWDSLENCSHDYCLAERMRLLGFEEGNEPQKPFGLPWSSGLLKYLPGHIKYEFPLRRNRSMKYSMVKKPTSSTEMDVGWITNPEICGAIDEMIYAYKVFLLAGILINEARAVVNLDKSENEPS